MVNRLRTIAVLLLAFCSLHCVADECVERDTAYFYNSWEQMLLAEPDTMITDLALDFYSSFELYFASNDKEANKKIKKEYISATLSDGTWFINSNYLKEHFKGDSKKLHGYVPVFFNEKVAYAVVEECSSTELGDIPFNVIAPYNYYIDFNRRKVLRVNEKTLSAILADYQDLRMRYEGMNNKGWSSIIKDFFLQYVDRATDDIMRPDILALLDKEKNNDKK